MSVKASHWPDGQPRRGYKRSKYVHSMHCLVHDTNGAACNCDRIIREQHHPRYLEGLKS